MIKQRLEVFTENLASAHGCLSYDESYWEGDQGLVKSICHRAHRMTEFEDQWVTLKELLEKANVNHQRNPVVLKEFVQESVPTMRIYWIMAELYLTLLVAINRSKNPPVNLPPSSTDS